MAYKLKNKSDVTRKYKRFVLTGVQSIGKSTALANIARKALVVDLENRWPENKVQQHDFPVITENYPGVKEFLNDLLNGPKPDNDWLVIDSMSVLMRYIRAHATTVNYDGSLEKYAAFQNGDKVHAPMYMAELLGLLDRVAAKHNLNIGLICHAIAKDQKNPLGKDYSKFCLQLPDLVAGTVLQWADYCGFAFFNVAVHQDGLKMKAKSAQPRLLTFSDSPVYEAKNGGPYPLPDRIDFDKEGKWADLVFGKRPLVNELETLLDQYPEDKVEEVRAGLEKMSYRTMPDADLKGLVEEIRKYVNNGFKKETK